MEISFVTQDQPAIKSSKLSGNSIADRLGVTPLINAGGPNTKHSSSRPHPDAIETMEAMSEVFVDIDELLLAVGERIAELAGNEGLPGSNELCRRSNSKNTRYTYRSSAQLRPLHPSCGGNVRRKLESQGYEEIAGRMKSDTSRIYAAVDHINRSTKYGLTH